MKNKKFIFLLIGALFIGALFILNPTKLIRQSASKDPIPDFKLSNNPVVDTQFTNETQIITTRKLENILIEQKTKLNELDQKKLILLNEILSSRNDNDPRLDQGLKENSFEFKLAVRNLYQNLPMEARNERGTIAYLISRDIQSEQDIQFLETIFKEEPCLSIEDCRVMSNDDPHYSGINQVSANYPQQVVIYQLDHFEQQLQKNPQLQNNPQIRSALENLLRTARQFPVPSIQQKAEKIQKKFGF